MDDELAEQMAAAAMAIAGVDGTVQWAGVGFAEMLGLAPDGVVGRRLHELVGPAAAELGQAFDLAAQSSTRQVSKMETKHDELGSRRLSLSFEPVVSGEGAPSSVAILAQTVVVDGRDDAQRYGLIFQHSLDGILYGTENGPIVEANPAACRMLGASAEELSKMRRQDVTDLTDPRLAERLAERRRGGTARGVLTMLRKDGTRFECELSSSIWRGANGEVEAVTLMRDLTDRQRLESKVRELQRLESLGTLVGGLAHDFNNIVAAIVGNVVLLREEADVGRTALAPLDEIDKAAERARLLVEQLMVFSRKRRQDLKEQALQPVIERGIATLRTMLPSGIQIRPNLTRAALCARVDANGVIQALLNLGHNSNQAMSTGHGSIDICLDRVELEYAQAEQAGGTRAGGYARIRVRDDGCGFDAVTRERLFDPFFTTRQPDRSTGMGLALVHSLVRDHGGMISATGSPGKGAEFTIYLPLVQPALSPVPALAPASPSTVESGSEGQGRHVFYIDDDEALVTLVSRLLYRAGFKVRGFTDPEEALRALEATSDGVDIVVTDFNMPGLSGLDVARATALLRPGLPVAIVSGYVTDELRAQAAELGVRAVLYKEASVRDFCTTIADLLAAR